MIILRDVVSCKKFGRSKCLWAINRIQQFPIFVNKQVKTCHAWSPINLWGHFSFSQIRYGITESIKKKEGLFLFIKQLLAVGWRTQHSVAEKCLQCFNIYITGCHNIMSFLSLIRKGYNVLNKWEECQNSLGISQTVLFL